jgi:hypothetical protein
MSAVADKVKAVRKRDGHYWVDLDKFLELPGGKYAAVTEILSVINKRALIHWAARTAATLVLSEPETYDTADKAAAGIYGIRDAAAGRGSTIHSLAEALGRGASICVDEVPEIYRGYAQAFASWVAQTKPTPLFTEANVYSTTHKYAGTTDLIAAFPDKQIRLIDYKTGKDIYAEVGLQMAAYRNCDFILPHVNGDQPIPMPPVAECAVVLLNEDGTFQYKTIAGDFAAFLNAKALWHWWTGK